MVGPNGIESAQHLPVVIIGAGFGGMALAVKLQEAGIEDYHIFEQAKEVGGTWRDNTYPGCACDVASNLYSYSFAPNASWEHTHGSQSEIFNYLKGVAKDFDLYPNIRFDHELKKATWNNNTERWTLITNQGKYTCSVLVTATGPFGEAVTPAFKGADSFKGKSFHTLHWDHNYDLRGKKVAIVGTGATAIQIVPEIQEVVEHLTVFQRTPSHVLPRIDVATSALKRAAVRHVPFLQRGIRSMWYAVYEGLVGLPQFVDSRFRVPYEAAARYHLFKQVKDNDLREQLSPDYRFGCKRPVFSSKYFPALQEDNVDLVCAGISEITENGIIDSKGIEHEIDTLIYATGYRFPHQIGEKLFGKNGDSLAEYFGTRPRAFMGTSVAGFPNLFMMMGPFSAAGNQSAVYMLETQAGYITKAVQTMRAKNLKNVDVREDVLDAFTNQVNERSQKTSWVSGGCESYFQNEEGGNAGLWPSWSFMHRWNSRKFDVDKYVVNSAEQVD